MTDPSETPGYPSKGPVAASNPEEAKPGIPEFELVKRIGRGSYGQVWLARSATGSYRAVKVVFRHSFESEKPYEREFTGIREFEPISRAHPGQLDILHVGRNDEEGFFYYVMELADDASVRRMRSEGSSTTTSSDSSTGTANGTRRQVRPESYEPDTLQKHLDDVGRMEPTGCLELAIDLTEALSCLHTNGLVHRDIKPSNVLFVRGQVKLADIGLVAQVEERLSAVGTEGFIPPEGPGQPTGDIYALGKVFYEMATGADRREFPRLPKAFEDTHQQRVFIEFNEIILRCCERSAENRYQTAADLLTDLNLLRQGRSIRRLRLVERRLAMVRRVALVGALVAAIATAGFLYQRHMAQENRQLAGRERLQREKAELATEAATLARREAEAAVRRHELQEIEQMFETDKTSEALALLAQRVRAHPDDSFAARRLLSALTYRNFALPMVEMPHASPGQKDRSTKIVGEDISPDNQTLATITMGGMLSLWNPRTGELIARDRVGRFRLGLMRYRLSVQFNCDGTRLVTPGGQEMAARIWKVDRGLELALEIERPDETGEFAHAEFSPDGNRVVAIDRRGRAFIWDTVTGEQLVAFGEDQGRQVLHVMCRFTQDGERVVTSLITDIYASPPIREVKVWNSETGALINRLEDHDYVGGQQVLWKDTISLDPRGSRMVYLNGSGRVHMWDYSRNTSVVAQEKHAGSIRSVAFSPNGRLVATGGDDQTVRLWEVRSDELRLLRVLHHTGRVISLAFSPDGERLASGVINGSIRLWKTDSGQPVGETLQHPGAAIHIEFTRDGKRLCSMAGSSIWMWDVRSGAARPNLLVHEADGDVHSPVNAVRFLPDGTRLVCSRGYPVNRASFFDWTTYALGTLPGLWSRTWDATSGKTVSPPVGKIHSQTTIALTPDGSRALTALDKGFTLWDPRDGTVLHQVEGIGHDSRLMALSPNGRWALTGNLMGRAAIWDLESGNKLWTPSDDGPLLAAAFSPDSTRLFLVTRRVMGTDLVGKAFVRKSENGQKLLSFDIVPIAWPDYWCEGQAHWSPDQRLLAFAHGWLCRFYDAESGEAIAGGTFEHHGPIRSSGFSADGRYFVTASADQTARVWDLKEGKQAGRDLQHDDAVEAAVFSSDGREIATASLDRSARLWDRETGLPLTERLPHPDQVWAVDIDPEGKRLATGCRDGAARIWELPQAEKAVPDWLLDLAEWLGGLEVGPSDSLDQVIDPGAILELKDRLNSEPADTEDEYVRWGRWFFADREKRAVSPSAEVGMEEYHRRLAQLKSNRR